MKSKILFYLKNFLHTIWGRLLLLFVGTIILLALSHSFWLEKLIVRLVPLALNRIAAGWNGSASVGQIALHNSELTLKNITLLAEPSATSAPSAPLLRVERISLLMPLWSLLWRQVPSEVDLEGAHFNLVRDFDGRWNFRPPKVKKDKVDAAGFQASAALQLLRRLVKSLDHYSEAISDGTFPKIDCHNCTISVTWENRVWNFKEVNLVFEQNQMSLKLTTSSGEKLEFLGEMETINGKRQLVLNSYAPSSLIIPIGADKPIKLKWASMKCSLLSAQKKSLQASCNWLNPSIWAEALADDEVSFDQLSLSSLIDFTENPLHTQISGSLGSINWRWETSIYEQGNLPKIETNFKVLPFNNQSWQSSIPPSIAGPLTKMRFKGNLGFEMSLDADFTNLDQLKLNSQPLLADFKLLEAGADFSRLLQSYEQKVYDGLEEKRKVWVGPENAYFVPYAQIPSYLVNAVLTNEDASFFKHRGFHTEAIRLSVVQNWREKKFKRGASTISMQFIKNVFLNRKKNLARKFQEVLLTWILENQRLLPKERMLEIYFNIIEFGPNVYGIGEASEFYFNKKPSQLSYSEALFLTVLIPSPKKFTRFLEKEGNLRPFTLNLMNFIAQKMKRLKVLPYTIDFSQPEFAQLNPELKFSAAVLASLQNKGTILRPDLMASPEEERGEVGAEEALDSEALLPDLSEDG